MANSTPNINLSLMKTGENVGTWGNVLNTNFLTIDSLLGEMKEGRGTYVNIADHLKSLTDSINSNNAAIIKTDGELTALKGTVTSYKEEAKLVAGRVDVLEKKTETLESDISSLKENEEINSADISANKEEIASLKSITENSGVTLADLVSRMGTVEGSATSLVEWRGTTSTTVEDLVTESTQNKSRLTELEEYKTSSTSSIDSINSQLTVASADRVSTNIARKQVFSNVQISKTQDDFNEISLSTKIRSEDVLISIYDYETSYLLSPSLFEYIKTESESGLLKIIIKPNTEFGKDIKRLKVVTIG